MQENRADGAVKVLVVEDSPDVARMMLLMLEALGAEARHAETVEAAGALLRAERFDLVVADYQLPDGVGTQVLRDAQALVRSCVLLTGYGDTVAAEAGDFRVETKPIDLQRLQGLLANAQGPPDAR